jgi:hypothetical protein
VSDGGGGRGDAAQAVSVVWAVGSEAAGSVSPWLDSSPNGSFGIGMRVVGTGFWSVIWVTP